jgi:hypothetical protein
MFALVSSWCVFLGLREAPLGSAALRGFPWLELDGTDMRRKPIEVPKAELAKLLRRAKPGLHLNEHISEAGRHRVPARLQAWVGRHRFEASRFALPIRALA